MKKTQDVKIYSMSVSPVIQTCIVSIILTAVITFMLWNTSGLNTVLENSTNSYVKRQRHFSKPMIYHQN